MATTKQAAAQGDITALLADEYLADLVYTALLERGEPSKVSEITLEINNPRILFPMVRRVVADSPRFLTIDRMWDLSARYLDRSRPTERNLQEILEAAGRPLSTIEMATELSAVYARDSNIYSQLLPKIIRNEQTYLKTGNNEYGLASWLPLVDADEDEDVLFDNGLTKAELAVYRDAAPGVKWSPKEYAESTYQLVKALNGRPVPHKMVGVLAYLAMQEAYDPRQHLAACRADGRLVWLTARAGGRWITRERADALEAYLEERGIHLSGEEVEEAPAPAPVAVTTVKTNGVGTAPPAPEPAPAEVVSAAVTEPAPEPAAPVAEPAPPPLQITGEDLNSLVQIIAERGASMDVSELLALQYEVVAGDPSYRSDVDTLLNRLKGDDRFLYVGAGRFREPNSLPLFVYSVPEFLSFPDLQFVSMDGEIMDEEIEDEGLAGTLRQDMMDPLAQDTGDDEGRYTGPAPDDSGRIRLVVKAHHKEIGTFPLCQIPDGFFPDDENVVEVIIRDPSGEVHSVIVNHQIRLAFNLFGLYEFVGADSGGVFYLHRTPRPFEFRFEAVDEVEPRVQVSPERISELMALREQAEESGDLATFDITCEILAHYPKGLDFVQALTEVNIVRRVNRRKLASILSNYYCFVQKVGTDQWRFDARKRDLGTDRAKRKYIKR